MAHDETVKHTRLRDTNLADIVNSMKTTGRVPGLGTSAVLPAARD